jgi:hypothetical protein
MVETFKLDDLKEHMSTPLDVFICCASFEGRSKTIADCISSNLVKNVLLCENEEIAEYVGENARYLDNRFHGKALHVPLSLSSPLKSADSLTEGLEKVMSTKPQEYLVDITTFTHEELLILLRLLQRRLKATDRLRFAYTAAKEYSLGAVPADKWLSKGIKQIRSVLGYPGDPLPTRQFHLVVLAGFENDRAAQLIDAYEPAIVSLGFGKKDQSITNEHFEVNIAFHEKLCNIYNGLETFTFSLIDPVQTKVDIANQIATKQGYNVVVAPLNNKISTIGSALAAFEHANIQLCYAQANFYNYEKYSSPGDEAYLFEIPDFLKVEALAGLND